MKTLVDIQSELRPTLNETELYYFSRKFFAVVLRDLALAWVVIATALLAVSRAPSFVTYFVALFMIGLSQHRLFILGHDGIHGNLHSSRKMNDWLCRWFIFAPMLMGLKGARKNHLSHHRLVGNPADPDRYLHSLENKA